MTRLYAMIANGGDLVTPHIAEDVEAPASDAPGSTPQVLRVLATQQSTPTGVNPSYLSAVQEGPVRRDAFGLGTSYGIFGNFPVPIAGKTGSAQKDVTLPGYPNPVTLDPVLVVRLRPVRQPVDRRLRRDRERRRGRERRRAGRAARSSSPTSTSTTS